MGSMQEKGEKMDERTRGMNRVTSAGKRSSVSIYEGLQGRPYNSFTPQSIATMSLACSLLAVVSLLLGA